MAHLANAYDEQFVRLIQGHWLDSVGNSIIVSTCSHEHELTAVVTPLIDHPEARDRVLRLRLTNSKQWCCGISKLLWSDEYFQRLVWVTDDGRRNVWCRKPEHLVGAPKVGESFPWLVTDVPPDPWLPLDIPRDILYDGARIAALLDIRQMIGPRNEPQERLTHILMDHDLHPMRGDYLIPGAESPLWQTLVVDESVRRAIAQRIQQIPHEALSQRVSWSSETEIRVGHHKITIRPRDRDALDGRWVLPPKDERKSLEIARLLALYSVFDNPLSNRRNGVHLGLDPELRRHCDYELFASPLNAAVANGRFASKWPHVEWRFGSIGSYPSVLSYLPVDSIVCVNPPFTEAYLADVMARLAELKLRFRLRIAVPIQEMPWRKKLASSLPEAQLLKTYYDASAEHHYDLLHPTLLWEDPRCPQPDDEFEDNGADGNYPLPPLELPGPYSMPPHAIQSNGAVPCILLPAASTLAPCADYASEVAAAVAAANPSTAPSSAPSTALGLVSTAPPFEAATPAARAAAVAAAEAAAAGVAVEKTVAAVASVLPATAKQSTIFQEPHWPGETQSPAVVPEVEEAQQDFPALQPSSSGRNAGRLKAGEALGVHPEAALKVDPQARRTEVRAQAEQAAAAKSELKPEAPWTPSLRPQSHQVDAQLEVPKSEAKARTEAARVEPKSKVVKPEPMKPNTLLKASPKRKPLRKEEEDAATALDTNAWPALSPATKPRTSPLGKAAASPTAKPALSPLPKSAASPLAKPAVSPLAKPAASPPTKPSAPVAWGKAGKANPA